MTRSYLWGSLGAAIGLLSVAGAASARRLPAWAGFPDPLTSGNCWAMSATQLSLTGACLDNNDHYFNVPLPIDSATSINPALVSRCTNNFCLSTGEVCFVGVTFDANGGVVASHPGCPNASVNVNGSKQLGNLTVAAGGAAMINIEMSGAPSFNRFYSNISYTP
jgi:hypothetical protein